MPAKVIREHQPLDDERKAFLHLRMSVDKDNVNYKPYFRSFNPFFINGAKITPETIKKFGAVTPKHTNPIYNRLLRRTGLYPTKLETRAKDVIKLGHFGNKIKDVDGYLYDPRILVSCLGHDKAYKYIDNLGYTYDLQLPHIPWFIDDFPDDLFYSVNSFSGDVIFITIEKPTNADSLNASSVSWSPKPFNDPKYFDTPDPHYIEPGSRIQNFTLFRRAVPSFDTKKPLTVKVPKPSVDTHTWISLPWNVQVAIPKEKAKSRNNLVTDAAISKIIFYSNSESARIRYRNLEKQDPFEIADMNARSLTPFSNPSKNPIKTDPYAEPVLDTSKHEPKADINVIIPKQDIIDFDATESVA